jgi:chromosome segregation ATPase
LAHLKAEAGAFEEGIRDVMSETDHSISSLREQLEQDLEDARKGAENTVKSELARYELDLAENIKQGQRDLEAAIRDMEGGVEERRTAINGLLEDSRTEVESWKAKLGVQLRDAENSLEEVRRRSRELITENDERFASMRQAMKEIQEEADTRRTELFSRTEDQARVLDNAIKDADRRLREFAGQTRLFEEADILRIELGRKIEDLSGDLNRLEQRRSEAAGLEAQFVKIKRLEDEVNAKMTRFLSEKRRIELMEADFNRLLQTSEAVEEKLVQVSSSDDTLQAMQVQLRTIADAMGESEERFQRIEKKNQILDAVNTGIDKNFKTLRETEETGARLDAEMKKLSGELAEVRSSVDILGREQEKVQEAALQAAGLDETLKGIEERIEAMNVAREWLAKTESRLQQISKDAQEKVKLFGDLVSRKGPRDKAPDRGVPTIADRENVLRLAHQGWKREEIARTMGLSLGEVELILELPPKE